MTTINQCECLKCYHKWLPRQTVLPLRCPKCNRMNWNSLQQGRCNYCRDQEVTKGHLPKECVVCLVGVLPPTVRTTAGRPPKYPIADLQVGELRRFPFFALPSGQPDTKRNWSMTRSIQAAAQRAGIKVMTAGFGACLNVQRVA